MSRDSAVGIAIGYGLDDGGVGVQVPIGSRFPFSLSRPDRLWAHPASYPMGTGALPPGVRRQDREAATLLQLVLRSRMHLYIQSPIRLRGIVIN
jgi:hypothetical protein